MRYKIVCDRISKFSSKSRCVHADACAYEPVRLSGNLFSTKSVFLT